MARRREGIRSSLERDGQCIRQNNRAFEKSLNDTKRWYGSRGWSREQREDYPSSQPTEVYIHDIEAELAREKKEQLLENERRRRRHEVDLSLIHNLFQFWIILPYETIIRIPYILFKGANPLKCISVGHIISVVFLGVLLYIIITYYQNPTQNIAGIPAFFWIFGIIMITVIGAMGKTILDKRT
jgi:hypothetical protein